jgi:phenylalanyl-tRNA synthetase beta chain
MKISLSWLNEYVDVKDFFSKPQELSALLTSAGLEVEAYTDPAKNLAHVVLGQIIELGKHPNADKLTLCQVDVGDGKPRQIVCGAKNHKQGDKVVVALPGAVLPGDFAIKLSKIRDVESQGMLCSETELGFKSQTDGIIILPTNAKVGQAYTEYAGLNDVVFEINVTPNRADCLSHVGLAREISCLLDRKMSLPDAKLKLGSRKTKEHIDVKLNEEELCPRYCGRSIFAVKVGPSPDWLKNRLQAVGLNSINNIVDVTNFVMMEYGQPLHAFDAKELHGQNIFIEKSKKNEKFKTFDGTEIVLTGEELTIRDSDRAVALAGVIGGINSGVTESTKEVFLEAAHFNPRGVRRTSRRHGVDTDSSQRFSRGTDPENVIEAMNRAVALIQNVAGGEVAKDFYDLYPSPEVRKPIKIRKKILEERLGYEVDMADFTRWMKRLHCKTKVSGDSVTVEAPTFRFDIEIEMDLVEEYARLNGYDKIPEHFPKLEVRPTDFAISYINENRVAEIVKNEGFFEAKNYNFVSPKWQSQIYDETVFAKLGIGSGGQAVNIKNPLSEETSQMRQTLLTGLLTNVIHNYHYGTLAGRLFEVGFVFGKTVASGSEKSTYKESHRVACVGWGHDLSLWHKDNHPVVYDIKSCIEGLVSRLGGKPQWRKLEGKDVPAIIHPGQAASLFYEGRTIGFIGALHPAFREEHKIRHDVAVCEVDLEALMRGQPRVNKLTRLSKFPAVERDLALLLPLSLAAGDVVKEIEKAGAPLLQTVQVFDVFRGQGIPEGHQSVAFRLVFQDSESTLSDDKLVQAVAQVTEALKKKFALQTR